MNAKEAYAAWTHIYQRVLTLEQKDAASDQIEALEIYLEGQQREGEI